MMDGLKRRPLLLQWVVALVVLTMLWGSLGPVFAQNGSGGDSNGSGDIITRECDPPDRCFSSVEARRDYATQNSCYFLEDICTDFDPEAGNRARDEDRGFWGRLWDAGVGAIQYGYDFVRGLMAGLGDQIRGLIDLVSDPIEAARGLVELGRAFYNDPEGTVRSLAQLIGQEAVDTIVRATQCGAYDLGRVIGQHVNPVVVLRLGIRLARFGGNLDDAVTGTRRDFGCASFVAGTPVLLPEGARAIEQIRRGDQVLSRDDTAWTEAPQNVTQLFNRIAPDVWELVTESETYRLTDNHPLWVQGKGWTETKDVTNADVLGSRSGDVRVLSNRSRGESAQVFNFKVDKTPSYFVGEQGLWAHNPPCPLIPGGGLSAHEGRGRGHTLERHVNVSTDDLRDRANGRGAYANPNPNRRPPPFSSRYTDRATAEAVIAQMMADRRADVDRWLNDPSGDSRLELDSVSPFGRPVGEGVARGSEQVQSMSNARVVLQRDSDAPGGFFILTSHPRL